MIKEKPQNKNKMIYVERGRMNYYRFGKYYNERGSYKKYRCTIDG
jgi:hypothetical protein